MLQSSVFSLTGRSSALLLVLGTLLPLSPALAAPVTYSVQGTFAYSAGDSSGNAGALATIQSLLPNGTAFSWTFDLDAATPDSDPSANGGSFEGAIGNDVALIGGFQFGLSGVPCSNASIDCRVGAKNDFVLTFDEYSMASSLLSSSGFNSASSLTPVADFFLFSVASGLFASPQILDPLSVTFTSGRMVLQDIDYRASFALNIDSVVQGSLPAPVPEPGGVALLLSAVGFLMLRRNGAARA